MNTTSTRSRTCTVPRRLTVLTLVLLVASTLGTVGCGSNRAKPDQVSMHVAPKPVHRHPKATSAPSTPAPALPQSPRIKNDSVL